MWQSTIKSVTICRERLVSGSAWRLGTTSVVFECVRQSKTSLFSGAHVALKVFSCNAEFFKLEECE